MTKTAAKENATRLYVVLDKKTAVPIGLIDAANAAQARTHVARSSFTVQYASQQDCLACAKAAVEIEKVALDAEAEE